MSINGINRGNNEGIFGNTPVPGGDSGLYEGLGLGGSEENAKYQFDQEMAKLNDIKPREQQPLINRSDQQSNDEPTDVKFQTRSGTQGATGAVETKVADTRPATAGKTESAAETTGAMLAAATQGAEKSGKVDSRSKAENEDGEDTSSDEHNPNELAERKKILKKKQWDKEKQKKQKKKKKRFFNLF